MKVAELKVVGGRLRAARMARDLSQAKFARQIGVAQSCVAAYEGGQRLPDPTRWNRIARACRIGVQDLFLQAVRKRPPPGRPDTEDLIDEQTRAHEVD